MVEDSDVDDDSIGGDEHDIIKLEAEDENHDESQSSSDNVQLVGKHAKGDSLDNIKCDRGNYIIHSVQIKYLYFLSTILILQIRCWIFKKKNIWKL